MCIVLLVAPVWVPRAHAVLVGHRSILNQVRYSAEHQLILSSGVEKVIRVHKKSFISHIKYIKYGTRLRADSYKLQNTDSDSDSDSSCLRAFLLGFVPVPAE